MRISRANFYRPIVPWRFSALALVMIFCAGKTFAAGSAAEFSSANELYAKGRFAEAAAAYEKMLQGGASMSLWFNFGNAEFKAGHPGWAIAAYRHAELLAPRDPEIRANLGFVRAQVQGSNYRESRWQAWVSALTLNEGAVLAAGALWVLLILLAAPQIRPALGPRLRSATRWSLVFVLLTGGVLAVQAEAHFNSFVAVVITGQAAARSGPFDDAQTAFAVPEGAELRVMDRHDDWVQVADAAGRIGWLNRRQAEVLPGV